MPTATPSITDRRCTAVRELRDLLRAEVLGGTFPQDVLPSEAKLMLTHRVARGVLRDALASLGEEGVIDRVQGTGTLVRGRRFERRLVEVHGVSDLDPDTFTSHVLTSEIIPMPSVVAHYLDADAGSPCLLVEYIGIAVGSVCGLYTNYVRLPEAAALRSTPMQGHWYAYLAAAGLGVGQSDLLIESVVADAALADRLGIAVGSPMLAIEQVIRNEDGEAFNFAVLRHRGDRLALKSEAGTPAGQRSALKEIER